MSENIMDLGMFGSSYIVAKYSKVTFASGCLTLKKMPKQKPFSQYGLRYPDFIYGLDSGIYLFFANMKKLF